MKARRQLLIASLPVLLGAWGCGGDSPAGSDGGTDADADADADSDADADADADTDADTDTQCAGQDDFTPCELVTNPDLSYDICIEGACRSPGLGIEHNVPGPHFPLPDSGQRLCYDESGEIPCPAPGQDFFGQDAQYGWDVDHEASERFTRDTSASGEPLVVDNVTGLIWQGCPRGRTGDDCDGGALEETNWETALFHCDELTWAGFSDWRLPDVFEIATLLDSSKTEGPTVDTTSFPGAGPIWYWSLSWTSFDLSGDESTWVLDSAVGRIRISDIFHNTLHGTRCVRGEPAPRPPERFATDTSVTGQPVVADAWTGLTWQGCVQGRSGNFCAEGEPTESTWKEALSYCEGLAWGGHTDWRLPSAVELIGIVETRTLKPSIHTSAFPNTPNNRSWTGTTWGVNPAACLVVQFTWGESVATGKASADFNATRCVRDQE